jgi:sugar lactone lactonase YvrE
MRFGETFGIAVDKTGVIFVSDGKNGKIYRIEKNGATTILIGRFDTPSAIAIDKNNSIIVADSGSHTIKRINPANGTIEIVAGTENRFGFQDGATNNALFNAPVGVAVADDKIFVADSYNDKIRVIENGNVRTIAGSGQGFADSPNSSAAKFNTPSGIAIAPNGDLIVADTGNRKIRRVEQSGAVTTLAGNGERDVKNPLETTFIEPIGVSIDSGGAIYVSDAGSNQIKVFGRRFFAFWETIAGNGRGTIDANLSEAKFNRPTNTAIDADGNLFVADSANKLVRVVKPENQTFGEIISPEIARSLFASPAAMRDGGEPRWCFNPPNTPRDIAGTFGELRGEIKLPTDEGRFHNGLDVAGAYGETARFVRAEKVLRLLAVEDFNNPNNRERLRMPTLGYIHIRIGRDQNQKPFDDARFQWSYDDRQKLSGVRVQRGAKFNAGDAIGTLNPFNHVHLIAGETGAEMNAFDALRLPGASDTVAPKIEKLSLFAEDWRGKIRVVVRAYDQMNGGNARRRLGVYRLGYQIFDANNNAVTESLNTISFERLPDESAANLIYAVGSQSGYTPETVFNYTVTNVVNAGAAREDFFDTAKLPNGNYKLRVFAADFFGNQTAQGLSCKIDN